MIDFILYCGYTGVYSFFLLLCPVVFICTLLEAYVDRVTEQDKLGTKFFGKYLWSRMGDMMSPIGLGRYAITDYGLAHCTVSCIVFGVTTIAGYIPGEEGGIPVADGYIGCVDSFSRWLLEFPIATLALLGFLLWVFDKSIKRGYKLYKMANELNKK